MMHDDDFNPEQKMKRACENGRVGKLKRAKFIPSKEFDKKETWDAMRQVKFNHYKTITNVFSRTVINAGRDRLIFGNYSISTSDRNDMRVLVATLPVAPFNALQDDYVYRFGKMTSVMRLANLSNACCTVRFYTVRTTCQSDAAAASDLQTAVTEGWDLRYGSADGDWCTFTAAAIDLGKVFSKVRLEEADIARNKHFRLMNYRDIFMKEGAIVTWVVKHPARWWPPSRISDDAEYTPNQHRYMKGHDLWIIRARGQFAITDADDTLSTAAGALTLQEETVVAWCGVPASAKIKRESANELAAPAGAQHAGNQHHVIVAGTIAGTNQHKIITTFT